LTGIIDKNKDKQTQKMLDVLIWYTQAATRFDWNRFYKTYSQT